MPDKVSITLCSTILNIESEDKEYFYNDIQSLFIKQSDFTVDIIGVVVAILVIVVIIGLFIWYGNIRRGVPGKGINKSN